MSVNIAVKFVEKKAISYVYENNPKDDCLRYDESGCEKTVEKGATFVKEWQFKNIGNVNYSGLQVIAVSSDNGFVSHIVQEFPSSLSVNATGSYKLEVAVPDNASSGIHKALFKLVDDKGDLYYIHGEPAYFWYKFKIEDSASKIPQNVKAEQTEEGMRLSWDAVEGAVHYTPLYSLSFTENGEYADMASSCHFTSDTSCLLDKSKFTSQKTWYFAVQVDNGALSEKIQFVWKSKEMLYIAKADEIINVDLGTIKTIKCDTLEPGDTFTINGNEYLVVDNDLIRTIDKETGDFKHICTSHVTDMSLLFAEADFFNQSLSLWDVSHVTTMMGMFVHATSFNQPLIHWDVSHVTDMSSMFASAYVYNQPLEDWDVSQVTNMNLMFLYTASFDQPLEQWDVSHVTTMMGMFIHATKFNQPLAGWDVSQVTDMSAMFDHAYFFNQPLGEWDVSQVVYMNDMFNHANSFNHHLGDWNVSQVTNMTGMFVYANSFNQPLGEWDVSQVTNMWAMFQGASSFNQPLEDWDVSHVTKMIGMFAYATSFNQPLENWDVSQVTDMGGMFGYASSFNQPLEDWDVLQVTEMSGMFYGATVFSNHDLSVWDVQNVSDHIDFLTNAGDGNIEPSWIP